MNKENFGSTEELCYRGQETELWTIKPSIFRDNMISVDHRLMSTPLQKLPSEFHQMKDKLEGNQLGLTADELAFYDALTKPRAIKDIYENEELIELTKKLADTLRKNKTIDWQKRDSARAKMRMLIKKLLKHHIYPPEGMEMQYKQLWFNVNYGQIMM